MKTVPFMERKNMERLSGEYNRGYTKAIQDIQEVFIYIQSDLKHHHKALTAKMSERLLKCCLENRERLRESINGFIRYNGQKQDFEFYEPNRQ